MTTSASPPGGMLLVTVDRLPAWLLPLAGCTWVAAPTLDSLAARGLVLDGMFAPSDVPGDTLAAVAGRRPTATVEAWPLMAEAAAAGWAPLVVTDDNTFAAGLPPAVSVEQVSLTAPPAIAATAAESAFGRLFAAATAAIRTGRHRFVWCHASSLGSTWDAPPSFRESYLEPDDPPPPAGAAPPDLVIDAGTDPDLVMGLRQVFAGQVSLLDACLGDLLETVDSRAGDDPWTLVFAGVRGMPLGLHGRVGGGLLPPYAELIQLPAVLVDHRGRMAAQRYGGLAMPEDLGQTLLDLLAGVASPDQPPAGGADPRTGRSLVGLLDDWRGPQRDRVLCRGAGGFAISTRAWHAVCPGPAAGGGRLQLFARPDDYFDACDVADRSTAVAEELAAVAALAETDPAAAWTTPLSPAAVTPAGEPEAR